MVECDKVSSHPLAICRKSSQNASSKLALILCPAMTLEQLMIEDFMAVPRQHFAPKRESNIIVTKIAARKRPPKERGDVSSSAVLASYYYSAKSSN